MLFSTSLDHSVFLWQIEDFCLHIGDGHLLTSPTFKQVRSKSEWHLDINASSIGNGIIQISVRLGRNFQDRGPENIKARYSIHIESSDGRISRGIQNELFYFKKGGNTVPYKATISLLPMTLLCKNDINGDVLSVTCEMISVAVDEPTNSTRRSEGCLLFDCGSRLVVGATFPKDIVFAGSPILAGIFAEGNSLAKIPWPAEVVRFMLDFLHTREDPNYRASDNPPPIGLYECAKFYELLDLQSVLEPREILEITYIDSWNWYVNLDIPNFPYSYHNSESLRTSLHNFGVLMQSSFYSDPKHGHLIFAIDLFELDTEFSVSLELSVVDFYHRKIAAKTALLHPNRDRICSRIIFLAAGDVFNKIKIVDNEILRVALNFKFWNKMPDKAPSPIYIHDIYNVIY